MPIWEEICRAEQKYMPFFWTVAKRVFLKKKSKAQKHIQIFSIPRSGFFPQTRSVMVPRFGFFFQDSRIRVKLEKVWYQFWWKISEISPNEYWFQIYHCTVLKVQVKRFLFYCKITIYGRIQMQFGSYYMGHTVWPQLKLHLLMQNNWYSNMEFLLFH